MRTRFWAGAALFGSGASALIYQVLWMRAFGLIFGNSTRATSVVLAVFMGGLAWGGQLSRQWHFKNALKTYAVLEMLMAGSALLGWLALPLLPGIYAWLPGLGPAPEFLIKALAVSAITLPTAVAAGMTLPVMLECLSRRGMDSSQGFAGLYSVNTLGAAFGVLSSAFFLIPTFGTARTCAFAILVNLMLGLLAWKLSWGGEAAAPGPDSRQIHAAEKRIPWLAFASGFSAFLLELVWVRTLVLVIGSSSYAFSVMLSSMLLGVALGAWIYRLMQNRIQHTRAWLAWTSLVLAAMILVSYGLMGALPDLYMKAIERYHRSFQTFQALGFFMSFSTLLLVTLPQGFLFPLLLSLYGRHNSLGQRQTGSAYFWNTLGALSGSLCAGLLLIPLAGFRAVYLLASLVSAIMGCWLLAGLFSSRGKAVLAGLLLACSLLVFKAYRPWKPSIMSMGIYENGFKFLDKKDPMESLLQYFSRSGNSLAYYAEGQESLVSVVRLADNSVVLANNGKNDASDGGDIASQKLVAHVPFVFYPGARQAYVIGWGSGSTAGSASLHGVAGIDCVEIEPRVFGAAPLFRAVNFEVWKDPRFKIRFNDARNDLLASSKRYDLILSEPSNPWIAGVSNLFTSEFYELARRRLSEHGVFGQWLPYYGMTLQDIQLQLRTFAGAFPHAQVWILADSRKHFLISGDLLLVGSAQDIKPDFNEVKKLFQDQGLAGDLAKIGVNEPWMLLSMQLLNRGEMLAFAGDGPLNTDGFPRIEFSAPRSHFRSGPESMASSREIFASLSAGKRSLIPEMLNSPLERPGLPNREWAQMLGMLAAAYSDHSQFELSLRITDEIRSAGRMDASATYYRGVGLFFSGRDVPGGIREVELALKMDPNEKKSYNTLCLMFFQLKKFDDAYRVFTLGAKKWPDEEIFSYGRAMARYQAGNYGEARALLKELLAKNPGHPGARSLLAGMSPPGRNAR